jgi:hypothetical protein
LSSAGEKPQVEQVAAAQEEAEQALVELPEGVRGIYPEVLTGLGLDGAVPVLTGRCTVPMTADIDVLHWPGLAAEATASRCIGELLANIGKHSGGDRRIIAGPAARCSPTTCPDTNAPHQTGSVQRDTEHPVTPKCPSTVGLADVGRSGIGCKHADLSS